MRPFQTIPNSDTPLDPLLLDDSHQSLVVHPPPLLLLHHCHHVCVLPITGSVELWMVVLLRHIQRAGQSVPFPRTAPSLLQRIVVVMIVVVKLLVVVVVVAVVGCVLVLLLFRVAEKWDSVIMVICRAVAVEADRANDGDDVVVVVEEEDRPA